VLQLKCKGANMTNNIKWLKRREALELAKNNPKLWIDYCNQDKRLTHILDDDAVGCETYYQVKDDGKWSTMVLHSTKDAKLWKKLITTRKLEMVKDKR